MDFFISLLVKSGQSEMAGIISRKGIEVNSCITTLGVVSDQYLGKMLVKRKVRNLFIEVIGMKYRKLKSSSLQSLEHGRKTEVDIYNGYITSKGRELGIATPVNQQLTRMVGEIEQGKRKTDPGNFNEISNIFL